MNIAKQALPNDGHAQALTLANLIIAILGEGGPDQASHVAAAINAYAANGELRAAQFERRRLAAMLRREADAAEMVDECDAESLRKAAQLVENFEP